VHRHILTIAAAGALALAAAPPGRAQQPAPGDTVADELARLRARLDSLETVVRELRTEAERRRAESELERLRATARRAAADTARAAPADQERTFVSRTRAQQALNPEISITGDLVGFGRAARTDAPGDVTAIPREIEFSFQTAIDPHARMKLFVSHEQELPLEPAPDGTADEGAEASVDIEEAYAYWVGLPGGLGLDVGKFKGQVGVLNRWHTHAWPEADFPLALRAILGDEGLAQTGVSVYGLAPWSGRLGTTEIWMQATAASNDRLFPGSDAPTALVHLNQYWDLSPATYLQVGATGLYGRDEDADDLRTRLLGADLSLNWRPPERALYREFTFRTEWLWVETRAAGVETSAWGGYAGAYYKLGPRWRAGVRGDFLRPGEPGARDRWQVAATLTRSWTEFLRLSAQWNALRLDDGTDHQFLLRLVWAVGPHREEIY
jgi:hypothetical protein